MTLNQNDPTEVVRSFSPSKAITQQVVDQVVRQITVLPSSLTSKAVTTKAAHLQDG
jgi:hypothetical protein